MGITATTGVGIHFLYKFEELVEKKAGSPVLMRFLFILNLYEEEEEFLQAYLLFKGMVKNRWGSPIDIRPSTDVSPKKIYLKKNCDT